MIGERSSRWVIRRPGLRTLLTLGLLVVVLAGVVGGLADAIRGLDANQTLNFALIGMLVGWGLAATPLGGRASFALASTCGFSLIFLRVGNLGGKSATLLRALINLYWSGFHWPPDDLPSALVTALRSASELWNGVGALLARVHGWALSLVAGEPIFDPVAAAFTWGLLLWGASAWAGWTVRRRSQPLEAIAPAGALLTATLAYARGGSSQLLVFLGATLLLLAVVGYDASVRRWEATGVDRADLGPELAVAAILLSLLLVTAAGLAPSISVRRIVEIVQELGNRQTREDIETLAESLGVEQQPVESQQAEGLPRQHAVGFRPELSYEVVMIISTGDLPPSPPEGLMERPLQTPRRQPPRYYWRSATYDRYVRYGWLTGTPGETIEYQAGEPVITQTLQTQRTVRQEVQIVGDLGNLLYAAGTLAVADQDYKVTWRSPQDAFAATIEAATYRADSLVAVVSEKGLRAAGTDYPEWVRVRYLALPDTVPARVLSLARDLTATAPTPYDRARAIEAYLRTIPYNLDVPVPPHENDVVDYFLFDLQEGYCDYYATAMVVLARAAGVPARYVTGYASGIYDAAKARYIVTKADAHAWAEVYFPGYGWVEFEPTAGLPPIERTAEAQPSEWPNPEGPLEPARTGLGKIVRAWPGELGWGWLLALPGGLVLMALANILWSAADGWWLRRRQPAAAATTLYQRLRRHGQRLAVPSRTGDTPYEFVAVLAEHVTALARGKRWGNLLIPVAQEARCLADLYVQASYSARPLDAADHARLVRVWQKLHYRLRLARFPRGPRGH